MDITNRNIDVENKKVFSFDLDGTLTAPRTWITDENLSALDIVRAHGKKIIITGAGRVSRIFTQLREYPVDIIGNYGLQYAVYNENKGGIDVIRDQLIPCDIVPVRKRIDLLREEFGFAEYAGDSMDIHSTGCVIFPLLGTKASINDKLSFDPDRAKRRVMYDAVREMFPEYTVFIAGSSSFDMVPKPYNKYYALDLFCGEEGYSHDDILYFGDDYGKGGNDEVVYTSDIDFVKVDKSSALPDIIKSLFA
ncbi:MAG: phosphomannomutase [Ruminococcaceae bacterium]|nr:phosphomannomutase [Oscillospiraceae bacterium]